MAQQQMLKVGAGLQNLGNTCFANSVLQCLTHTAPLMDYFFTREHYQNCCSKEFCMMCVMDYHIKMAFRYSGQVITPYAVINHLPYIAEHFVFGQQEDAHEFLNYSISKLRNSCSNDNTPDRTEDQGSSNMIDRIFMGSQRSQLVCQNCHHTSDRYEEFLDIPLEINSSNTILQALKSFVKVETLEGDNAYRCSQCNQLVTAKKRCTIHEAPNILTLSLQRFNMFTGSKLTKKIKYPTMLNLRQYTSDKNEPLEYNLYGVLVHSGSTCQSGHYYSYVKGADDQWYLMNDSHVKPCDVKTVLDQEAYLLFYSRAPTKSSRSQPAQCSQRDETPDQVILPPCKENATSIVKVRRRKPCSSSRAAPVETRTGVKKTRKARQDDSMERPAIRRKADSDSNSAFQHQQTNVESAKPGLARKKIAQKRKIDDKSSLREGGDDQPGPKLKKKRIRKS